MATPFLHSGPLVVCPACREATPTLLTRDTHLCAVCGTPKWDQEGAIRLAQIAMEDQVRAMFP